MNSSVKKKRVNTRQKGRRNELRTKEWLEERGYAVEVVPMPAKYKLQQDFFGLFDLIAFRAADALLVQVKTNAKPHSRKLLAMSEFPRPAGVISQVFIWKDRVADPIIITL